MPKIQLREAGEMRIREWPLCGEEAEHEGRSSQSGLHPSLALPGFVQDQINNDGGHNAQQREA